MKESSSIDSSQINTRQQFVEKSERSRLKYLYSLFEGFTRLCINKYKKFAHIFIFTNILGKYYYECKTSRLVSRELVGVVCKLCC